MALSTPVLTDGVVTLRTHTPHDVDDMIAMGTDPETVRWTTVPTPYERSHALDWVELSAGERPRDATAHRWAIEAADGSTPRFAGNIDLRLDGAPDLGYALAPWARGRGLMQRAVRLVTAWAFDALGLPVVHWSAHAGNFASWRVAHACGFTYQGAVPLSQPQRGTLHDGWFATLRPDDDTSIPRTTWWPVPVLENERVRLRPFTDADVPRIVEACSDERTRRWLTLIPHPYTEESARAFIRTNELEGSLGKKVSWAVVDPADDLLLANVGIFRLDGPFNPTGAEIGYWAHPQARGRGVVSTAVQLVLDHAFTPVEKAGLGRSRVVVGASWTNTASRRVAEANGFTLYAHTRMEGLIGLGDDMELDDGAWYELLAVDH
ncbi:GNAT family N-acetyltransferase [Pseudonocardia sp. GCM10023141]|uniref:GNAT family N-acetyltransferase n=1 Tax=Pseudonocardia sp. GCM10023141 TaxID=3252653 RepID=UPI003615D729